MSNPSAQSSAGAGRSAHGLGPEERSPLIAILREHGVLHASLFGSFARGEQRAESDIDLLNDMPEGASLLDLSHRGLALEDALGRSVDLVTALDALHPVIQERLRREEEVLL